MQLSKETCRKPKYFCNGAVGEGVGVQPHSYSPCRDLLTQTIMLCWLKWIEDIYTLSCSCLQWKRPSQLLSILFK